MECYDRQGHAITFDQWTQLYAQADYKILTKTDIGGVKVSTVWLGLDHAYLGEPPLIFETMVFGGTLDQEQARYTTEAQAFAGHGEMCERVRAEQAEA